MTFAWGTPAAASWFSNTPLTEALTVTYVPEVQVPNTPFPLYWGPHCSLREAGLWKKSCWYCPLITFSPLHPSRYAHIKRKFVPKWARERPHFPVRHSSNTENSRNFTVSSVFRILYKFISRLATHHHKCYISHNETVFPPYLSSGKLSSNSSRQIKVATARKTYGASMARNCAQDAR